ncbi:phage tail tape measure protein [Blastochloris tepida]|uniref:Phage tail tape measure protein domain-containing protein n=1 Tax=Blastochloris tepida TaxID=2233851 RepID=A0A348FY24_9HYPH|nr:phage tail tape measure protein [Blastochloris tepida]BBF92207.1 hypothetical protein BLTE_08920 [Blastochloris tepida]
MGNIESSLTLRLIDRVTDPAKRMSPAFQKLERQVRHLERTAPKITTATAMLTRAGGFIGAAVGGHAAASLASSAFTRFAEIERRLNRIGITANASSAEIAASFENVKRVANTLGMPMEQVFGSFEDLIVQGKTLKEANDLLETVAKTAHASGAAADDTSKTVGAIAENMKVGAGDMKEAMDYLFQAGNLGRFEFKDMAQYLPAITAAWSNVGYTGAKGLIALGAALQVVRAKVGTAEQAATGVRDLLAKAFSNNVQKNFRKFGIDLEKVLKQGKKEGKDFLEILAEVTNKALKGDLSKIGQLWPEQDSANAVRALIMAMDDYVRLRQQIADGKGAIDAAAPRVSGDAKASLDRLSNASDAVLAAFGRLLDAGGNTSENLTALAGHITAAAEAVERFIAALRKSETDQERRARGELTPEEAAVPLYGEATPADIERRKTWVHLNARIRALQERLRTSEGRLPEEARVRIRDEIEKLQSEIAKLSNAVDHAATAADRGRTTAGVPAPGVPVPHPRPVPVHIDWSQVRNAIPSDFATPGGAPTAFGNIADELAAAISGLDVTAHVEGSITYNGTNVVKIEPSPLFDARVRSIIDEQLRGIVQRGGAAANPRTGTTGSTGVSRPETAPGAGRDGTW